MKYLRSEIEIRLMATAYIMSLLFGPLYGWALASKSLVVGLLASFGLIVSLFLIGFSDCFPNLEYEDTNDRT